MLSLLAVLTWLGAISLAILADQLLLQHSNLMIGLLLGMSVMFSINAFPRPPHKVAPEIIVDPKQGLTEH